MISNPDPRAETLIARVVPTGIRQRFEEALLRICGPVLFERYKFRRCLGYLPNWQRPRTFNEKLVAMKLFADLPQAACLSDKVAAREYVARVVGANYLNEALLVLKAGEAWELDRLPQRFAARSAHASGMNLLVQDKLSLNLDLVRHKLRGYLAHQHGRLTNEWWYRLIEPRILVEALLEDTPYLLDYNMFTFGGRVEYIRAIDRSGSRARDFYDRDWNLQSFYFPYLPRGSYVDKPAGLGEMIEVAEALAAGTDFLRVDLYCIGGKRVVFGELTITPTAGWGRIAPRSAAFHLGSLFPVSWQSGRLNPNLERGK